MKKKYYETDQNHPQIKAYKEAVERGKQSQHVLPRGNSWVVKKAGSDKATRVFSTQKEAASLARMFAENQGTAVFIHGKDGRVKDSQAFYSVEMV